MDCATNSLVTGVAQSIGVRRSTVKRLSSRTRRPTPVLPSVFALALSQCWPAAKRWLGQRGTEADAAHDTRRQCRRPKSGTGVQRLPRRKWHDTGRSRPGSGTFPELRRHADYRLLDGVVLSHGHLDHLLDILTLRYALAYNPIEADRQLPLWLPPGGLGLLDRLAQAITDDPDGGEFLVGIRGQSVRARRTAQNRRVGIPLFSDRALRSLLGYAHLKRCRRRSLLHRGHWSRGKPRGRRDEAPKSSSLKEPTEGPPQSRMSLADT